MLKVIGTRIHLTRGDTAELDINVKDLEGKPYDCHGDKAYFRVKRYDDDAEVLLTKELEENEEHGFTLYLEEEDTMDFEFGRHRYEIELVTSSGRHYTLIEKGMLKIGTELESHDV